MTPDTFNLITNAESTRDIQTVSTAFNLNIQFQTTNPIPSTAKIIFQIPTDQAVIDTTKTFSVTDDIGGSAVTVLNTLATSSSTYSTFTLS